MNVKGATKEQIDAAAQSVGVRIYNYQNKGKWRKCRTCNDWPIYDNACTFTLKTGEPTVLDSSVRPWKLRAKYRRFSYNGSTCPGQVCWHGHRDYLRELFKLAPAAVVKTSMAIYHGAAHFEKSYPATLDAPSSWQASALNSGSVAGDILCSCEGSN